MPVPAVLACDESCLIIEWIDSGRPSQAAAAQVRPRAREPACGWGRPVRRAVAGSDRRPAAAQTHAAGQRPWPDWYAANRVLPYARIASDAGTLSAADVALIESACARLPELAGPG